MKYTNINSDKMKKINLKFVLDSIRQREPISRKELAEVVGLTSSSITNIVNRLIGEGYLVETGTGESLGGRRPIMLELDSDARYAIGVELNASDIICLITNFKAKTIIKKECESFIHEGKEKVINRMVGLVNRTIEEAHIPKDKIMGIGLVSAGPYDHEKGIMVNPPNFPGWHNVPIKDIMQDSVGIPTYFEKETVGAALGEFWFGGAADVKSLFVINVYNIGIGGGVIIEGQVYHGFKDGAGDLGHMVIDPEGPLCTCGNYGCLESVASGMAIVKSVKSEIKRGESSILTTYVDDVDDIDINLVVRGANEKDNLCERVIEKSARYMGIAMSNIINIYSPEMMVIGGQFADVCPLYAGVAIENAKKRTYPLYNKDVRIVRSTLGNEQGAIGGIGIVFQEFYKKLKIE